MVAVLYVLTLFFNFNISISNDQYFSCLQHLPGPVIYSFVLFCHPHIPLQCVIIIFRWNICKLSLVLIWKQNTLYIFYAAKQTNY